MIADREVEALTKARAMIHAEYVRAQNDSTYWCGTDYLEGLSVANRIVDKEIERLKKETE